MTVRGSLLLAAAEGRTAADRPPSKGDRSAPTEKEKSFRAARLYAVHKSAPAQAPPLLRHRVVMRRRDWLQGALIRALGAKAFDIVARLNLLRADIKAPTLSNRPDEAYCQRALGTHAHRPMNVPRGKASKPRSAPGLLVDDAARFVIDRLYVAAGETYRDEIRRMVMRVLRPVWPIEAVDKNLKQGRRHETPFRHARQRFAVDSVIYSMQPAIADQPEGTCHRRLPHSLLPPSRALRKSFAAMPR